MVSIAVVKHQDHEQLGAERVYYIIQLQGYTFIYVGSQGKNLETGSGTEIVKECCLLTC